MTRAARVRRRLAIVLASCALAAGVFGVALLLSRPPLPVVDRVQQRGELVVAMREAPSTYHEGAGGPDGFEYALVRGFADHLGVDVRFVFPGTLVELLDDTMRGAVHLASGGLAVTPSRRQRLLFSNAYEVVDEQLIYRRGSERPRSLDDIAAGDLHVIGGSSHEETLTSLRNGAHPGLGWISRRDVGVAALLDALERGEIRLTIVDSNEVGLSQRLYKRAAVAFDIGEPRAIAWAFPKRADSSLRDAANAYLREIDNDGRLQRLRARYFGHAGRLNFVDTRDFWRAVRDRLPAYRAMFEQAAADTGLDWRLLAAIGYQESHWRADAVSPTGVRGIMMLTQATAKQMKISDRNDPAQSITGGARYLRVVEKKIPERIPQPNRLWLTLAGYNIGFGHLEDARILTQRDGGNPDLWMDVKQRLPLLAKKKYHTTVRHGFARGGEPVTYVDNIRNYYDMLVWFTTTADDATRERLLAQADD
ncbi:MAG: membrane-bound lytic murein transglycosylase MltF [Gammaproteobacteria bacterium]|nr:membrane-bound lytic murein transglycosylase MltF [Gammaproteobacteria bacterium]